MNFEEKCDYWLTRRQHILKKYYENTAIGYQPELCYPQSHDPESSSSGYTWPGDNVNSLEYIYDLPFYPEKSGAKIMFWMFILKLLSVSCYRHIVSWTWEEWEFVIKNPAELSRMWGLQKHNLRMRCNYIAAYMEYYHKKNIIHKTAGKQVYRFVNNSYNFAYSTGHASIIPINLGT